MLALYLEPRRGKNDASTSLSRLRYYLPSFNIIYIMRNDVSVHLAVRWLRLALVQVSAADKLCSSADNSALLTQRFWSARQTILGCCRPEQTFPAACCLVVQSSAIGLPHCQRQTAMTPHWPSHSSCLWCRDRGSRDWKSWADAYSWVVSGCPSTTSAWRWLHAGVAGDRRNSESARSC